MRADEEMALLFGQDITKKIKSTKVLVIGAGGIGCELLKNLVKSSFKSISLIDLDTIDLSNLNRQFLFKKEHIGQSKAIIARESCLKYTDLETRILAHHASIYDPRFNLPYFKSFDLVLNALDNIQARRHVNKMCLAARVPLIESGTAGYHGQGVMCYDCTPKEIEKKTFPVCTIRSTPSDPIHCIVWSKNYLFTTLFGRDDDLLEDNAQDVKNDATQNDVEIAKLQVEATELQAIKDSIGMVGAGELVFEKVFHSDIKRLLSMDEMWKSRTKPRPLLLGDYKLDDSLDQTFDQSVWTLEQSIHIFLTSIKVIGRSLKEGKNKEIEFDKDDPDSLNFITASSTIRSHIFNIPSKTRFEVKEMAGNIIPAIATTNAIVAGMIVLLAIRLIKSDSKLHNTFVAYGGDRPHLLLNEPAPPPNPACVVCSSTYLHLLINPLKTISEFITFCTGLGLLGELSIQRGEMLVYDIEFDDNLHRTFDDLQLIGCELVVTNDSDDASTDYCCVFFVTVGDGIEVVGECVFTARPIPEICGDVNESKKRGGDGDDGVAKRVKIENVDVDEFAPINID